MISVQNQIEDIINKIPPHYQVLEEEKIIKVLRMWTHYE